MEVMEDGNLMDKVHILIQRDMEYYTQHQTVLQETICPGIIGGKLDFPRSASFAAMKLVLWWEEEYIAAFRKPSGFLQNKNIVRESLDLSGGCGGIVKASDPAKFVSLISKSADQLLEHLHVLTQEALDHADLTVLTGTIGASALLKNCVWFYIHTMSSDDKDVSTETLQTTYKKYHEMCEALAERLLDLHIRLISMYILQDTDCLNWENSKPFFENERGSYVIQMWWLYMQGTKEDLWSSVPPKMAQRVFAGMLNESLTILTVRYTQSCPSEARSNLLVVDISNLLLCVAQLLPTICDTSEEFMGVEINNKSKMLRDIHVKCQNLLFCLLVRGPPLDILYKAFKKQKDKSEFFNVRSSGPLPWVFFALPNIFKVFPKGVNKMSDLSSDVHAAIELMVLTAQPQPNWSLLYKVLSMNNMKIVDLILNFSLANFVEVPRNSSGKLKECAGFLCPKDGSCKNVDTSTVFLNQSHYYDLIFASTYVTLFMANDDQFSSILLSAITKIPDWAKCFERRHVWNQIIPAWYEAILSLVEPILPIVSETVINALQTEATIYQAMSLTLATFSQFVDYLEPVLFKISNLIQELVPSDVVPLNSSCLIQILISALYTNLISTDKSKNKVTFKDVPENVSTASSEENDLSCAAAEALCCIDEENKHTDQLEEFLEQVKNYKQYDIDLEGQAYGSEENQTRFEVLVSDLLITAQGSKSLKHLHHFVMNNKEWLFQQLQISECPTLIVPNRVMKASPKLLSTMFHIGNKTFDELLIGQWKPNWQILLQEPMGVTVERLLSQLSLRWELKNTDSSAMQEYTTHAANNLTSLFKQ